VPRAYNIFRAYEGMEGKTNKNKEIKNSKTVLKTFRFKNIFFFQKPKFHYKPTCEVVSV
jgi:hypothetical protein